MIVLGIETSCDETGLAIYDSNKGLLAHALYSQVELHAEYGGVVPELASRDHVRKLIPLLKDVLNHSGLQASDINGIAYTAGPGLVGALLVGASFARSLAYAWDIPCVGVHHMEGHLLAPMLEDNPPEFPFLALLVSGGHTMLVDVEYLGKYEILGESLDDAVGEAFDKTAKLLDLGYPGGPAIAKLAEKGVTGRFKLPRPMMDRPGLDFSFSGLKTAVLRLVQEEIDNSNDNFVSKKDRVNNLGEMSEASHDNINKCLENSSYQRAINQTKADIALAFEEAIVDTLVKKSQRAIKQTGRKVLVVAGGVSANIRLREQLSVMAKKHRAEVFFPRHEFCTDNGAMIAYAGWRRLQAGQSDDLSIRAQARWPIGEL